MTRVKALSRITSTENDIEMMTTNMSEDYIQCNYKKIENYHSH